MPAANVLTEPIEEDDVRIGCVLHLDPAKDLVILLDVGGDKALPGWRKLSGFRVDLEEGNRRLLRRDPWLEIPRPDDRLTDAEWEGRDRAWSVIDGSVPRVTSRVRCCSDNGGRWAVARARGDRSVRESSPIDEG